MVLENESAKTYLTLPILNNILEPSTLYQCKVLNMDTPIRTILKYTFEDYFFLMPGLSPQQIKLILQYLDVYSLTSAKGVCTRTCEFIDTYIFSNFRLHSSQNVENILEYQTCLYYVYFHSNMLLKFDISSRIMTEFYAIWINDCYDQNEHNNANYKPRYPQTIMTIDYNVITSETGLCKEAFKDFLNDNFTLCNCLFENLNCSDNSCCNFAAGITCTENICSILHAIKNNDDNVYQECQNNVQGFNNNIEVKYVKLYNLTHKKTIIHIKIVFVLI